MKKIFLIVILFGLTVKGFSQNAYNDAIKLESIIKDGKFDGSVENLKIVTDILSQYVKLPTNKAYNFSNLRDYTGTDLNPKNPFLAPYMPYIGSSVVSLVDKSLSGASSVGGLDVTNIADGFARFIVKRTKEELSITFFEKFKKELDRNPNIRTVFPQTYKSLNAIDKEIYMFKAYIQTLREAFEEDLSNLPDNLPTIIDNNSDFFDKHLELKAALLSSFYLADQIKDGTHPGEIIENFPDEDWDAASINKNYRAAFKTIKLFSKSFRNPNDGNAYWFAYSEIKKLFQNDDLLKIYLGLIVEQAKLDDIVFEKSDNQTESLYKIITASANLPNDINSYKTFIKDIAQKTQSIELKVKELPTIENDSLKFEKYYSIISNTLDLMRKAVKIEKIPHFPVLSVQLEVDSKRYFDMAQTTADAAIGVNRRNYASVIVSVLDLYNKASEIYEKDDAKFISLQKEVDKQKGIFDNLNGKDDKKAKEDYENAKASMNEYVQKNYKSKYETFFKYGTFMATVAQAKNSEQVEDAIEAFALPTGSARIKRETLFNVALNAYCGLFYGGENIKGLDNGYKGTYGITAPIGISISWGKQYAVPFSSLKNRDGNWSSTFFISIIDIGAITAFRFQDDVTESVPTIELKDIISPGIFYSFGIPKSPLSVNLGYQIGPLLRKVTSTDNSYQNSYSRISIAFVVDIPLLNFYTKSK